MFTAVGMSFEVNSVITWNLMWFGDFWFIWFFDLNWELNERQFH